MQCSFIDSKKRLWFGTEDGLNLYNRDLDQFKKVRLNIENNYKENIFAIEEDSLGNLLIGTNRKGLYKIDINTLKSDKILIDSTKDISIRSIKHTKQGKTFVGTNQGLKEIDFINNKLIHTRLFTDNQKTIDNSIEVLFIDNKDNLWIGFEVDEGV